MAQGQIELRQLDSGATNDEDNVRDHTARSSSGPQNVEFSLPPVDTGRQAWLFLAACWGVEALTFGQSDRLNVEY